MTRMERRRRRRRILRIKLATTAAVLALTTASIVALTGGAAETASEPTPQPPALQAEPVLLVAEHDSTYQPVQMTAEPVQEPEPVEEEDENEKIEAALLEQGYLHEEIPLDFDLQCHLIAVCEEYGVPQSVALGVIQAESSFTATGSSRNGVDISRQKSINNWPRSSLERGQRKIRRMKQMAKIPENVLNVLGECRADGNLLYLPSVQLDRKTYTEVNKVLENMGGKWNRKAKAHVFAEDDDVAEMLENVLLTQEVKDLKREYQFFPTPRAVAERMCEMAEIDSASEVLEPSCGNGQLADVIWEHLPAGMCCIELNTDMKRYLSEKPYGVNYRDFLDVTKKEIGTINRVVMNPPFTRHQDIDHVRHAYDLLDAGGVLVAIMCESTFFRSDKKSVEFRDFLDSVYAQTIKLEPGAFRESGTDVVTRIVKIRKPL